MNAKHIYLPRWHYNLSQNVRNRKLVLLSRQWSMVFIFNNLDLKKFIHTRVISILLKHNPA